MIHYNVIISIYSQNLSKLFPLGLYVSIDEENILQWNGTLIIKEGVYQNLFTLFRIIIPCTYPNEIPNVYFTGELFHPLIDKYNGEMDVRKIFAEWVPGKTFILHLLFAIKEIFLNPIYFRIEDSLNPECGKICNVDYNEFKNKVKENVKRYNRSYNTNNNNWENELDEENDERENVRFSEYIGRTRIEDVRPKIDYNKIKEKKKSIEEKNKIFKKIKEVLGNKSLSNEDKYKSIEEWFDSSYVK